MGQETFEENMERVLGQVDRAVLNIGRDRDPSNNMLKGAGGSEGAKAFFEKLGTGSQPSQGQSTETRNK